jgi:hypothetical protein
MQEDKKLLSGIPKFLSSSASEKLINIKCHNWEK